jgi:hypothetical protein
LHPSILPAATTYANFNLGLSQFTAGRRVRFDSTELEQDCLHSALQVQLATKRARKTIRSLSHRTGTQANHLRLSEQSNGFSNSANENPNVEVPLFKGAAHALDY